MHNFLLPDLQAAVVILTNAEYSDATSELAEKLQNLVGIPSNSPSSLQPPAIFPPESAIEARAHQLVLELAQSHVNRDAFAPDALETFTPQAVSDICTSLAPLGDLQHVTLESTQLRGGTKHYSLTLIYQQRRLQIAEYGLPDGKIEQFFIDDKH